MQQILRKKAPFGAFLFLLLWWGAALATPVLVSDVIDGDTVVLADGRSVRLIGLNTPELGKDGSPDEPLARIARERLTALIGGRAVTLLPGSETRDHHGRLLAHLILADGRDVQELLLREGLGALVAIPPNLRFLARYQAAAEQARRARRGIWADPFFAPQDAESVRTSGFRFVRGTVTRVERRRHDTLLHISARMALLVPHANAADFVCPLSSLRGRRVEASGWVTLRKDSRRMRVQHPAMLRLLDGGVHRPANLAPACAA